MLTLLYIQQYQVLFNLYSKVTQNAEQKTRNHTSVESTFIEGKKGLHVVVGFFHPYFQNSKKDWKQNLLNHYCNTKKLVGLVVFFFK